MNLAPVLVYLVMRKIVRCRRRVGRLCSCGAGVVEGRGRRLATTVKERDHKLSVSLFLTCDHSRGSRRVHALRPALRSFPQAGKAVTVLLATMNMKHKRLSHNKHLTMKP